MEERRNEEVRQAVRKVYGELARGETTGRGCVPSSCCYSEDNPSGAEDVSVGLGYTGEDLSAVPEGSNLGLGCGNPHGIASLKPGEKVLDLGSGGGLDCFLAASAVGREGAVIGVDMTPEMVYRSRENAKKAGLVNVEFRLGEIEHLPVSDESVDVIISNCVINLSPEKEKVFGEAYRVLKKGGRLAIADILSVRPLPDEMKNDPALYTGCIAGAVDQKELEYMLEKAGFTDIRINAKSKNGQLIREQERGKNIEDYVASSRIEAVKP